SGNRNAIRLKGDTTEFNADSFRTQPNASVEDLLKKLPGIQVDKNGKITAQGEAVKKVLVDGEEFFGDDPTLVTQNLRADMVDKVQVYDKKSDQASFTGIDDGKREKTINLKIKDGKKNGYFGRVTAGAGTEGYHDYQLMANYFKNKLKLSGYGIIGNTGKTGLNWNERDNFGQSDASSIDVDENTGSLSWTMSNRDDLDSWSGRFEGQGFPSVKTGGLHFNNKWNDDQQSLNGNYKYMQLDVNGESSTNSQYILPDTFYYNNQSQKFRNQILRHSFNGSYEYKFDSTSSLKLLADGGTDHKTTNNIFHSEALASDSSLVNQNDRTTSTVGDNRVVNSNLLWRKKLAKKGRTLSLNVVENYTENKSDGYLNSETRLYQNGIQFKDSLIDQYKNYQTRTLLLDAKLTYTEPLGKSSFLSANYGGIINNSHSDRNSFNKTTGGKYGALDSLYSNDYQYNQFSQRGGLTYILVKKKLRATAGTNILFTKYRQDDLHADTSLTRSFVNWNPVANATYSFSSSRRLNVYYVGNTTQPLVSQIQPIRTNEDPLNITIGNPDLKPSFANRFSMYFNDYKLL
ncbi:MAG: outer membrane beta-barrel protein, partial [Bacteroidetes bacterium]|nr:outer membrane beta-barrel protein [Bacteroidota bacterium]